ncbi:MAG: glucose-1-phosphate cytidylyltransferase [Planctomycetes bacterium]|nr:glucose-1-phosphate cytidylyltransferase [Planctomycetota bacterium]
MNTVILAGGLGTRLAEETDVRPKPMVEVGGQPLLWHIMRIYSHFGHDDFVVALGYKGETIKRFFVEYHSLSGSMSVDLATGDIDSFDNEGQNWFLRLIDTGMHTETGGRLRRLQPYLKNEPFMLTYGDGLANVDIDALLDFHHSHGRIATITAVRPPARFGGIEFEGDLVREFTEKPQVGEGWINGGFMVFEPEVFRYLDSDATSLERCALERLARDGQLAAYRHEDFWQCADTIRDLRLLRKHWKSGNAPWKVWDMGRGAAITA